MKPLLPSHTLAIFLAALVVRLGWMPTWSRLVFEGHESLYRDAFLGESVRASTQAYPVLTGIYAILGEFSQDPRALVVFSAVGVAVVAPAELLPQGGVGVDVPVRVAVSLVAV